VLRRIRHAARVRKSKGDRGKLAAWGINQGLGRVPPSLEKKASLRSKRGREARGDIVSRDKSEGESKNERSGENSKIIRREGRLRNHGLPNKDR